MNEIAYLKQLPENKAEIKMFANAIINQVKEGNECPARIMFLVKSLTTMLDEIKKGITNIAVDEAMKYPKSLIETESGKMEVVEAGVKYDYNSCNDRKWNQLNTDCLLADALKKEREAFLKNVKGAETIVDTDTGEVVEIYPPLKISTTTVKITLK